MELLLIKALTALAVPPGGNVVLGVIGVLVLLRRRALGLTLVGIALLSLYLLSVPALAVRFVHSLETYPPFTSAALEGRDPGAIVILGGGRDARAPEYGGETVSRATLARLRYGARLYFETGLPVLVTGGRVFETGRSEAALMKRTLVRDFDVPVRWLEERSRNTAENALYTREMLAARGVEAIILVTDAWHMPRAVDVFEEVGFRVVPAPTGFHPPSGEPGLLTWLPTAESLGLSARAAHEYLGRLWYRVRY